jgi:phage FluMu protein gp41
MKSKTNISIRNNSGIKVTPNIIIGETFRQYTSGDLLDANATAEMVKKMIHDETILFNSITS